MFRANGWTIRKDDLLLWTPRVPHTSSLPNAPNYKYSNPILCPSAISVTSHVTTNVTHPQWGDRLPYLKFASKHFEPLALVSWASAEFKEGITTMQANLTSPWDLRKREPLLLYWCSCLLCYRELFCSNLWSGCLLSDLWRWWQAILLICFVIYFRVSALLASLRDSWQMKIKNNNHRNNLFCTQYPGISNF